MSYYVLGLQTKDGQSFPEEIYRKARDFYYLFQQEVEWSLSPNQINFYYGASDYDIISGLEWELERNHVTRNMVEFYKWACEHCEVYVDCKNPCDFKEGPDSMEELMWMVDMALKIAADWKGPVESAWDLDIKVMFLRPNYKTHMLKISLDEFTFEVEMPEEITYMTGQRIQEGVLACHYQDRGREVFFVSLPDHPQVLALEEAARQKFLDILMKLEDFNLVVEH